MVEQDLASIAQVRKLVHRTDSHSKRCECVECVALRRVCTLAREAVDMKEAKRRKESKNAIR